MADVEYCVFCGTDVEGTGGVEYDMEGKPVCLECIEYMNDEEYEQIMLGEGLVGF